MQGFFPRHICRKLDYPKIYQDRYKSNLQTIFHDQQLHEKQIFQAATKSRR